MILSEPIVEEQTNNRIKIFAVCGSVRAVSATLNILQLIGKLSPANVDLTIYQKLADLPAFNPDLDVEASDYRNAAVDAWRESLRAADALIICTPEYAHGVPGVLKNALDWVVSSGELVDKPTAIITASPSEWGGEMAMAALLPTIKVMSARISPSETLKISFVRKKIDQSGNALNEEFIKTINVLLGSLLSVVENARRAAAEL